MNMSVAHLNTALTIILGDSHTRSGENRRTNLRSHYGGGGIERRVGRRDSVVTCHSPDLDSVAIVLNKIRVQHYLAAPPPPLKKTTKKWVSSVRQITDA